MFTLRVARHEQPDRVLAECSSHVLPSCGETLFLDTLDADGTLTGPITCWRVVSVSLHVPSIRSARRRDGRPHQVDLVDVTIRPDVVNMADLTQAAQESLTESRRI
ncbi:MAG: hypothetical protein ACRENQ_03440 [Gemmatimonadaceae bacterium]